MTSLLIALSLAACSGSPEWHRLPPLPDRVGVAAPFAGVSAGTLLVGGGANFPNGFPWQGGTKVWHDRVWGLEAQDGTWRAIGALPRPLAYGVSVTFEDSVICVGGSDAQRHYADAFQLRLVEGKLKQTPLPPLPLALAHSCGCVVNGSLYIVGGAPEPGETTATNRGFVLDLRGLPSGNWREMPPLPGKPRFLAVAAGEGDDLLLFGGVALVQNPDGRFVRDYLRDAWRFVPGAGWTRLVDAPKPVAAAPSPAPRVGEEFLLVAGDDGSLARFQPVENHPGFPAAILAYHPGMNTWREAGATPASRATLPCVEWRGKWIFPSGEMRPGVRSPEVWMRSQTPRFTQD